MPTERRQGCKAYKAGLGPDACPHMPGSIAQFFWNMGWAEAQTEAMYHASAHPD